MTQADSLCESRPFSALAQGLKCSQSKDQQGELQGSPGKCHANQYHHI